MHFAVWRGSSAAARGNDNRYINRASGNDSSKDCHRLSIPFITLEQSTHGQTIMSLSFVSKSVQTTTEDGGFVEQAIEGASNEKETTGVHKPLFEQLRANKEQEEAEREEYQKSIMRGTLALDEEDAAHLESLRRKEKEQQDEVHRRTEQELAAFRAARADRSEGVQQAKEPAFTSANAAAAEESKVVAAKPKLAAPQIRIKRKRRKEESNEEDKKQKSCDDKSSTNAETTNGESAEKEESKETALGSLLTGYGSSSDED